MQTHAWMQARVDILQRNLELRPISPDAASSAPAIAPLVLGGGWLRELPAMFEPSDLCWENEQSLNALAVALSKQPYPVQLERVPADSPSISALRRAYRGRGIVLLDAAMPTPFIELGDGTSPNVAPYFSASWRAAFRRAERKANQFGPVGYEIHAPGTPDELEPLLQQAMDIEGTSWKNEAGTALTVDHRQGEFFYRFAQAAIAQNRLRIAFLRIGQQAVAMQIAYEWKQRFWLFKISYDQSFAACSPGNLLMRHTLAYAVQKHLLSYELMGVMDGWTRHWTTQIRRYVRIRAIPFHYKTSQLLAKGAARKVLGKLRRILG